jgi:hypothetical protein
LQNERDYRESIVKEKQRSLEIDIVNKELDVASYTYDF